MCSYVCTYVTAIINATPFSWWHEKNCFYSDTLAWFLRNSCVFIWHWKEKSNKVNLPEFQKYIFKCEMKLSSFHDFQKQFHSKFTFWCSTHQSVFQLKSSDNPSPLIYSLLYLECLQFLLWNPLSVISNIRIRDSKFLIFVKLSINMLQQTSLFCYVLTSCDQ